MGARMLERIALHQTRLRTPGLSLDAAGVALGARGLVLLGRIDELVPAIELAVSRFAEKRALEDEVATLSERLETRKVVDRAKGLLMTRQQMTEPEAFRWIQRTAMDRRTTMKAVAEAVVEGLATPRA